MPSIALETPKQFDAIRQLTVEAFAASEFAHNGEADLIDRLRENCPECVSFVAMETEQVVGHILFAPVVVRCGEREIAGMGLGRCRSCLAFNGVGLARSWWQRDWMS